MREEQHGWSCWSVTQVLSALSDLWKPELWKKVKIGQIKLQSVAQTFSPWYIETQRIFFSNDWHSFFLLWRTSMVMEAEDVLGCVYRIGTSFRQCKPSLCLNWLYYMMLLLCSFWTLSCAEKKVESFVLFVNNLRSNCFRHLLDDFWHDFLTIMYSWVLSPTSLVGVSSSWMVVLIYFILSIFLLIILKGYPFILNNHHNDIKFTHESEEDGEIPFLDVHIQRKLNRKLFLKVQRKKTCTFTFTSTGMYLLQPTGKSARWKVWSGDYTWSALKTKEGTSNRPLLSTRIKKPSAFITIGVSTIGRNYTKEKNVWAQCSSSRLQIQAFQLKRFLVILYVTSIDDNTMYIKMVQLRKKTQSTIVDARSGRRNIWFKIMYPLRIKQPDQYSIQ